jgi:large repetitive protein
VTGGQRVTIHGSGFGRGVSAVQVGGRRLGRSSVRVLGPTSLTVTLPAAGQLDAPKAPAPQDGAGPANVIVVGRGGQASAPSPAATFHYVDTTTAGPVATVDAIAPSGGLSAAPRPVAILGSGMRGATSATFGGVPARRFAVRGDGRITATPPPLSADTRCAPLPSTPAYRGESAANDVCQVHVQVLNGHGASAAGEIRAPYEGAMRTTALGVTRLPAGCGCEGVPAPDEYDYVPAPRITSVSTSSGPTRLASETGGSLVTIRGRGLNPLALDWGDFGDPARAGSQDVDYAYLSGTRIQIRAPARRGTLERVGVKLSVKTLAGQSPFARAVYAGIPRVTGVTTPASARRLHGVPGASDAGGTPIRITGRGFAGQIAGPLLFVSQGVSGATDYAYHVSGGSAIDTTTVSQTPARVDVVACSVSGCSATARADRLWLYAPGDPAVTGLSPASGPASGGTRVTIRGANLSCPLGVWFGRARALRFRRGHAALDCGSNAFLTAGAPPASPGTRVPVSVQTVQSYFTGAGRASSSAQFRYR